MKSSGYKYVLFKAKFYTTVILYLKKVKKAFFLSFTPNHWEIEQ